MNTLSFIAGMGAGSIVSVCLMLGLIKWAMSSSKDTNAHLKATEVLLKERNEIDREKVKQLEMIAAYIHAS